MGYASQSYDYKVTEPFSRHVLTDLRLSIESRVILSYCVNPNTVFTYYSLYDVAKSLGFNTNDLLGYLNGKELSRYFVGNYSDTKQNIIPDFLTLSNDYPDYIEASPITTLYYIRIKYEGDIFYKIGITCSSVENRFREDDIDFEILDMRLYKNREDAYKTEQDILNKYPQYRYKGKPIINGGNSEIFTEDVLNLDVSTNKLPDKIIEAIRVNCQNYPMGVSVTTISKSLSYEADNIRPIEIGLIYLLSQNKVAVRESEATNVKLYYLPNSENNFGFVAHKPSLTPYRLLPSC